jgi:hypothetical protein
MKQAEMLADARHYRGHPGDIPDGIAPGLLTSDAADIEQPDLLDDDFGLYICDRTKAFDRVCHLYLVRALCALCGTKCEWRPSLAEYLDSDPVRLQDGTAGPIPSAVRWIAVLLHDHHRKAIINGAKTDGWSLLCSVFQGCPLAPMLYAVACEFEGRLQIGDEQVTGHTPQRPCDLLSCSLPDIIAARFADDTQNLCNYSRRAGSELATAEADT